MAVRLVPENLERRIVHEVHDVRAAFEQRLRERLNARAHQHRANLDAEFVRQFPRLAEKLERDFGELAFLLLGKHPDLSFCPISHHEIDSRLEVLSY